MKTMNYEQAIRYIYDQLPMFQQVGSRAYKAGLDNIEAFCAHLGNPQNRFRSIHVGGTNGKGSSTHLLAAVLQAAGYKVGLFTSPHLKDFSERVRINGQSIEKQAVAEFVNTYQNFMTALEPSFFEMSTALAFDYFAKHEIDIAIMEVGMGGRLDATNIIQPEISLITNISYDHQAFLGNTLPKIAGEKAGIIKKNTPIVLSERQEEVVEVFEKKAKEENAKLYFADQEFEIKHLSGKKYTVSKNGKWYFSDLICELQGNYQTKNMGGVLKVLELLALAWKIEKKHIETGFANVIQTTGLKGRWQILGEKPLIVADTAHNEGGISWVTKQLAETNYANLHIVFGVVGDKDRSPILQLLPKNAKYYFCQAKLPRALDAKTLTEEAQVFGLQGITIPDVNTAFSYAKTQAKPEDMIYVGGSTFVVAEIEDL